MVQVHYCYIDSTQCTYFVVCIATPLSNDSATSLCHGSGTLMVYSLILIQCFATIATLVADDSGMLILYPYYDDDVLLLP